MIAAASLLRKACHSSQSCCNPSQKSADIPRTCASRSAVSDVTLRLPRIISFKRGKEIPRRTAKADWLIPRGLRNSSSSISPGCVGGLLAGSRRTTGNCDDLPLCGRRLVVVRDFDLIRISILPVKAHAILLIGLYGRGAVTLYTTSCSRAWSVTPRPNSCPALTSDTGLCSI